MYRSFELSFRISRHIGDQSNVVIFYSIQGPYSLNETKVIKVIIPGNKNKSKEENLECENKW